MADMATRETRQMMIAVRVSPSEKQAILGTARATGRGTVSTYLRSLLGLPDSRAGTQVRTSA